LEGYLTNGDFTAALMNGLGSSAFIRKQYADAERWYEMWSHRKGQNLLPRRCTGARYRSKRKSRSRHSKHSRGGASKQLSVQPTASKSVPAALS